MAELLEGTRVLEVADGASAAFCGRMFARLGADVMIVERPRTGSQVRWLSPFLEDLPGAERSGVFLFTAAGKRSITLDRDMPDGKAIMERLLARADLLIEDTGDALFSDRKALAAINPKLVHLEFLKFSRGGLYQEYVANELQLAALGGWLVQVGYPERTPLMTNSAGMIAFVPGIVGAVSALASLNAARRTGHGTHLDLSAHETLLFTTRFNETYFSYTGLDTKRAGNTFAGLPAYRVLKTADGYVSSAAGTDVQVEALMKMAGIASDLFATRDLRNKNAEEFCATLDQWFAAAKRGEVFHQAQRRRIPLGTVATIDEVVNSEQAAARGFFEEIDHPVAGRRIYPGGPAKFSETPVVPRRAPLLGEHTATVLMDELGFSREDLAALAGLGVI